MILLWVVGAIMALGVLAFLTFWVVMVFGACATAILETTNKGIASFQKSKAHQAIERFIYPNGPDVH